MKTTKGASSRRDFLKKSTLIGLPLAGSSSFRSLIAFQASAGRSGRKGQSYPDQRRKVRDPKTGATMWQLTDTPGKWTEVIYFTNRTATPDTRYLIYISNRASQHGMPARGGRGEGRVQGCDLFKMDLRTGESMQLTEGANIEKDSPDISADGTEVYFIAAGNVIRSVNLESLREREIARFDPKFAMHHAVSASPDKKVLVCHMQMEPRRTLGYRWAPWASRDAIVVVRLDNGEKRTLIDGNTPLGHQAICPKDPNLLLYSHHSPIHASQRAWLIHMDGTKGRPIFPQRLGEGIGHEIWGASGKTVYMTVYGGRQPQGMWVTHIDGANEHCVLAGGTVGHISANSEEDRFVMDELYTKDDYIWISRKGSPEPKELCKMPFAQFGAGPDGRISIPGVHSNTRFLPSGTGVTFASGNESAANVYLVEV